LVVAINPNGLAMWAIPFQTVGVEALQQFISEWASPDFHQFFQQPFLWLLLATLAAIGLSSRRLDGTDLVTFVGFAYLGFIARRNFGPFAMVAAPILARHLWPALLDWNARIHPTLTAWKDRFPLLSRLSSGRQLPSVVVTITNAVILGLLLLVAGVKAYAVSTPTLVQTYERQLFPVDAVEWIRANQPPGKLFNSYNYGGYLIWHLRDYPVFVDGRTDLFGDDSSRSSTLLTLELIGLLPLGLYYLPQIGLFFILIKPQVGFAVALYWLGLSWQSGGIRQVLKVFLPIVVMYLLSFMVYGYHPLFGANLIDIHYNVSLWPWSIPLGIFLVVFALKSKKINWSMLASPLLSPYIAFHSFHGVFLALVRTPIFLVLAVVFVWFLRLR
jgi:hypothetical protein